jgi:hypothetical protein
VTIFADLLTQHVSGTNMAIIRSTNSEFRFWYPNLESRVGCVALGTQLAAQRHASQLALQVWIPKAEFTVCTPDDGHIDARNILSQ